MYEVVFQTKKLFNGIPYDATEKAVVTNEYKVGNMLPDGRRVVSVTKMVTAKPKTQQVKTKAVKSVEYLKPAFDGAWGRSKWKATCEFCVEGLFEKLEYDMVLERAGCKHPAAFERWTDFKETVINATFKNQLVKEKLAALENQPLIKNYFLSYRR